MNFGLMIKKTLALIGIIPGIGLLVFGAYNAIFILLSQVFSDLIDMNNFSFSNLLSPFTSAGGSGNFIDSLVAGPGASGGSAIRYWIFMFYALISGIGFTIVKVCWEIITKEKKLNNE